MACVAVTSLVRTLELEFLQPQTRPIVQDNELISRNKELIEALREKLEFLMEQFDEKRMDGVEAIKNLETKLRDVAFRVEDEIEFQVADLCVEKLQRDTDEEKTRHCFKFCQIFSPAKEKPQGVTDVEKIRQPCFKLQHILQQAIEDTDHIQEELVKVKNEYEHDMDLHERNTALDVLPKSNKVVVMGDSPQHASHIENIMVGKKDEFKTIKEMLMEHAPKQQKVVSIKGMGGIGKTTLARRVYEDPSIVSHFDERVWVVASQHHNKRQMLLGLLNLEGDAKSSSDEELGLQLYQSLKRRRYLVVMDDVWSREAWDVVRACFPDDKNGSRVLLTTRLVEVANYVGSDNGFSHQMKLLDQSESWNLFYKKSRRSHDAEFEAIARPLVKKCSGLPLAIVVAAGLFSKLNTLDECKHIARALNSSAIATIDEECSRILSLSYNHLPHNLKACFLYLGVFPEDKEIYANNLGRLWAAEGFIKASENESFEVVAEKCIEELKDRNLILASKHSSYGRKIKKFRMHDILHAFCVREAQNENLLNVVTDSNSNFHQRDFRWISIQSSSFNVKTLCSCSKNCRSIFKFAMFEDLDLYLNVQNFNILRVLYNTLGVRCKVNIKNPKGEKFRKIVDPVHLRYIHSHAFEIFVLKQLNPWNLQTVVTGSGSSYSLDFPQLRYFHHFNISRADPPRFVHQNLQSISGLGLSCCTKQLFTNIPYLKKVKIWKDIDSTVNCTGCIGNLSYLQLLESLTVTYFEGFKYPINNQIALLKNLKKLSFVGTCLKWEEINVLSTLPRLEVLKLGRDACEGKEWKLREEEKFCQLICLILYGFDLEHWEVSGDHFPKLERLLLNKCYNLRKIPSSFADISTLESIELIGCLPSAVISAKQIQEEQHDQGNYNMLVIEEATLRLESSAHGAEEECLSEEDSSQEWVSGTYG